MSRSDVELVVDAQARLGEGPVWDTRHKYLAWVDIEGGTLHIHDPAGQPDLVHEIGCRIGAAVPRRAGGMILATENGLEAFDPETGKRTLVAAPENHLPENRFNDGKCDAHGRFWAGTMSMTKEKEAGSLYVLDPSGEVRRMLAGVTTSNGLGWSPDGQTMYYIDTPTMVVTAFHFEEMAGDITDRRVVVTFPEGVGRPDGMTVDAEGMLWIAHWDGGRVTRWNPRDGRLLATVRLPADRVTSCTFGGEDLKDLYVTTAREGLQPDRLAEQPHSGGLFKFRPGVRGLPAYEYAG